MDYGLWASYTWLRSSAQSHVHRALLLVYYEPISHPKGKKKGRSRRPLRPTASSVASNSSIHPNPKTTAPPSRDFFSKLLPPSLPAISAGEIACPGAGLSRAASPHSPPTAGSRRGRGCCRPLPPARAHSSGAPTTASPTPPRFGARSTPPPSLPPARRSGSGCAMATAWCVRAWLLSAMCLCFCRRVRNVPPDSYCSYFLDASDHVQSISQHSSSCREKGLHTVVGFAFFHVLIGTVLLVWISRWWVAEELLRS
jgi:hypothetical protein